MAKKLKKSPKKQVPLYEVVVLQAAIDEGKKELNDGEYWYVVKILRKLINFEDKVESSDLDIRPIDGIFELRAKGILLAKKNMRFFFNKFPHSRKIVIAKSYRKDEEGATPRHIIINAHTRLNLWEKKQATVGAAYRK